MVLLKGAMIGGNFIAKNAKKILNTVQKILPAAVEISTKNVIISLNYNVTDHVY